MTTTGTWYPPALGTGGFLIEGQVFINPPFKMTTDITDYVEAPQQAAGGGGVTAWQLHPTEPNTWQVFAPWGQCIAVIRPAAGTDHWEGAIRPRPDQLYPGVKITSCPSREAGIAVIARELAMHWPELEAQLQ